MKNMKRGFTLIELLIVIGILAILATVVILFLNPTQFLSQARDAQRLSDLGSVKSAIALYLSTASTTAIDVGPYSTVSSTCGFGALACTVTTSTKVDGTGWVRVDLTGTSGGSSLSAFPLDPLQISTYQYAYKGDAVNKTFELDGRLESIKYRDMMGSDGGNQNTCPSTYTENTCYYEIGTDPGLDL